MRYIEKGPEPDLFREWKSLANEDWSPSYDKLGGREKKAVVDSLLDEQGHICCYCESRISTADSHIEHFRPQNDPEVDPLDYGNMLLSCQKRSERGAPRTCGNAKGSWFDPVLLISPMDGDCESHFGYGFDGAVFPSEEGDGAADETIRRLDLNHDKLKEMRAAALEPFLDENIDIADLTHFVTAYLKPNADNTLNPYWATVKYCFNDLI